MIKANEVVSEIQEVQEDNRIDALARVLGFKFEDGEYVSIRGKKVAVARKRAVRVASVVSVLQHRTRRVSKPYLSTAFYDAIRALQTGNELDVTEALRLRRINITDFARRMYTWQWQQRQRGASLAIRYSVRNVAGRIFVRREV